VSQGTVTPLDLVNLIICNPVQSPLLVGNPSKLTLRASLRPLPFLNPPNTLQVVLGAGCAYGIHVTPRQTDRESRAAAATFGAGALLLVRQASAFTCFDLGVLSDTVQHIVEEQQQHEKQWMHGG
jgi:hypothetical protein